jgi:hypothetical protein
MELPEKVARGLRRRQFMAQQQRQRLVLTELVEILGPLAAGRPHRQQARDHLRGAQTPFAAFQLDLPVNHRSRPGLAKRLDQPRYPGMPSDQPGFQLNIDFKIQPIRHFRGIM